eukprot:scaffold47753_cov58-Attheya_sp.AAC.7
MLARGPTSLHYFRSATTDRRHYYPDRNHQATRSKSRDFTMGDGSGLPYSSYSSAPTSQRESVPTLLHQIKAN